MIFRKDRCSQGLLLVTAANALQLVGVAGIFFQEPTDCSNNYFKVHLKDFDMSSSWQILENCFTFHLIRKAISEAFFLILYLPIIVLEQILVKIYLWAIIGTIS